MDKRQHVTEMNNKRPWILVATWFGTIALVGLLKHILERQRLLQGRSPWPKP